MKKNELSSSKEELLKDRTSIRTFDKKLVCEDSDSSTKSWMLDDKIYEPDSSGTEFHYSFASFSLVFLTE